VLLVYLLFNLPYLTSVLDISACPKGFWGQNTNLKDLNYPTIPQLGILQRQRIIHTQALNVTHLYYLWNILSLLPNNHILVPIIKIFPSTRDMPKNEIKSWVRIATFVAPPTTYQRDHCFIWLEYNTLGVSLFKFQIW